ncbi:MAG: dihydroorotase [Solirubrobacterales bacterium]
MKLLVKGGRILDPATNTDLVGDLLIEDGVVKQVAASIKANGADVIDAADMIVCPGLIDLHVHLREPGFEYKETIASGTRAAANGGFTSVCCMPNTKPVCDQRAVVALIEQLAADQGVVNVYPIASITKGQAGQEITEMGQLRQSGCVAVSDDGKPVMSPKVMQLAMQYAKMFSLPVVSHCEDLSMADEGQVHEGYYATYYGLKGIPALAESLMVARDLMLARESGARIHIAHISTAESVALVRQAKAEGVRATCEVTPHHLALTDEVIGSYDPDTKVNPPLRSAEHVQALIEGLRDGTIDCIATDHAPHELESKDCEYNLASFGISGLETAVAVLFDRLVKPGLVPVETIIRALTASPAAAFGLGRGSLEPGSPADVTIINPKLTRTVKPEQFASKGKNTPFKGMELTGWPVATIVSGRVVMVNGELQE